MSEIEGPFFRAGADGVLIEEFRALAETNRYPERPVLVWLAKFIVGAGGGPNKDSPIYELCHLATALKAIGDADARAMFFLGLDRAVPRTIKPHISSLFSSAAADGVELTENGFFNTYEDGEFEIRFGRMPFLMALYEFLATMDGFGFYEDLSGIFDDLAAATASIAAVKAATNKISSRLRHYRRAHMTWAKNDENFDRIFPFLAARAENNEISIDDESILDFWLLHSHGKEFRWYKTVFHNFIKLMRALEKSKRSEAVESAVIIGGDFEAGEVEPDARAYDLGAFGEWTSPFTVFDEPDLSQFNFFKDKSERKPLEPLMRFGPEAIKLPLAFLRVESFAPIQSGITNDLRVKRGARSVRDRITCSAASSYTDIEANYQALQDHVSELQKGVLHLLLDSEKNSTNGGGNVVAFRPEDNGAAPADEFLADADEFGDGDLEEAAANAARAFKGLTRKGFEAVETDDARADSFRLAAGALVTMGEVLHRMLDAMANLNSGKPDLEEWFENDQTVFKGQFGKLYGDVQ